MTRRPTRTVPVRAERSPRYPNDYLHTDRPYEQTQNDIGGSLFLGAITLIALMALIVVGLV
jgi:hypothetical protein